MKIEVKVQANSGREEIQKISDSQYKIFLKKPAEKNKANIELLKLLKKYFGTEVKILKGKTSKNKTIEVK
ncbi:MAG: DUF167 domain-containing protein [Candidatus Pacearchaeota archaeon]